MPNHSVVIVIVLAALLAVSAAFNITQLAGEIGYLVGHDSKHDQSERNKCDTKLRSLGHLKTADSSERERQGKQVELDGLCYQIRSAEATERATHYAWWSLAFLFIATSAALAAAAYTRRQANIAETAYRNLERPNVLVIVCRYSVEPPDDHMAANAQLRLVNYGRTAAMLRSVSLSLVDHDRQLFMTGEIDDVRYGVIPPNEIEGNDRNVFLKTDDGTPAKGASFRGSRINLLNIRAHIEYADALGTVYIVKYRLRGQDGPHRGFRLEWYEADPPFIPKDANAALGRIANI